MIKFLATFCDFVRRGYLAHIRSLFFKTRLGYCGKNVGIRNSNHCRTEDLNRMYMYDNTSVKDFTLISAGGKFIMKKGSGAAEGLTVITGNHQRKVGHFFQSKTAYKELDIEKDVIVEEDVWLGANVTLLAGVTIGRGASVGAEALCLKSVPPYSVVMGNPAKVVGFNFTPEEILEHEKALYSPEERLPMEMLEKNYKKYFLDRVSEIKNYTRI